MSAASRLMQSHTCPPGVRPIDRMRERPSWAEPGQLTRVSGEERWGRVAYVMNCCGERIVEFAEQTDGAITAERMRVGDLENPYAAPGDKCPHGYLIPEPGGRKAMPMGGWKP